MSSIVINPRDQQEFRFLSELLKKLGIDIRVLSDEEMEDLGLVLLMKDADRSKLAEEKEVMSKLKN